MNSTFRRQEIINAAFSCIEEAGHLSLSTTELASMVGISQPAIFRHFRSKQQLYDAILDEANSRILERLKSLIGQAEQWKDPLALVNSVMAAMAADFRDQPGIWLALIFSRNLREKGVAPDRSKCAANQLRYTLEKICTKAVDAGVLEQSSKPQLMSDILVSLLFGMGQEWLNRERGYDLPQKAGYAIETFLNGHRTLDESGQQDAASVHLTAIA
ncbi:MAG: TetR/AcrR family transcriptional regulator [Cohaesibacter sp.]|nr:TetR/AcrR family transcriptional regulator [Cohaesibacter sp.]